MNKFSSPIAFYSGVQHCVATSTAHSEMLAVAKAVVMVIHLRELLDELSLGEIDVTPLYEDNSAVVAMSQNAINSSATMHFAIKSAFVREQIKAGVCCLVKIGALEQVADVLTKALTGDLYYKFRAYIVADCAGELAPRAHHA
jgi:predicted component of type VI protein secretion system